MEEDREKLDEEREQLYWRRVIVPRVFQIISTSLPRRDVCALLRVSPWCRQLLESHHLLWKVLDLHEMNKAGDRLIAALSLVRYKNVEEINLEFAQNIEDKHLMSLKSMPLHKLQCFNLNGCQKVTDSGVEAVTVACPKLKSFSIYWNVRVTNLGVKYLVKNCNEIVSLNLSGCKNIIDQSLELLASHYKELKYLNLTRCVKLTDNGLIVLLNNCRSIENLNLYADSSFTDKAYEKISQLTELRVLDVCGAQNLSDQGLLSIAKCRKLKSLNLTWCVRITDVSVKALAQNCPSLEFLSLFGILGVTDSSLEMLSKFCSQTLATLDVNGCINIKKRSNNELLQLFPKLTCFKVHS
eukprot:Gb_12010 [translate_table: standard]